MLLLCNSSQHADITKVMRVFSLYVHPARPCGGCKDELRKYSASDLTPACLQYKEWIVAACLSLIYIYDSAHTS